MTGKATTVFLAVIFASQVALTAVSFADGKKGKGGSTVSTAFKAKLAPPLGAPGECEGEAKYKKKVTTITPLLGTPTITTVESFTGEVECPILDVVSGSTDVYDMHLARITPPATTPADYAVCSLVIKEIEFEYQSGNPPLLVGMEGEYAVKVSQKTVPPSPPTLKQKVGSCTVFPVVQAGDTATVFLQGYTLSPLLTGTFSATSGDDDDD
jgi:hypothetical protein